MALRLGEIFVLAAFGEFASLERADDPLGTVPLGSLGDEREIGHCASKDGPAFVAGQDALIEQRFEQFGAEHATGEAGPDNVALTDSEHSNPPSTRPHDHDL